MAGTVQNQSAENAHHNRKRLPSTISTDQLHNAMWTPMRKGQRLFTGPGGVRDYRAHVVTDDRMVGIGTMSPEGTSELRYIWRGATGTPPPKPRSKWVGEIGWYMPFTDVQNMNTGHQINLATFRHAQEDKYTHRFQEPWYPSPNHPNYTKGFPFTKGRPTSTVFQNSSQSSYAQSKHERRPHTVASFQSTSGGRISPNVNNSAHTLTSVRHQSDYSPFSQSPYRPSSAASHISAVSLHSGDNSYFIKTPSYQSNSNPNSRPASGGVHMIGSPHPPSVHLSTTSLVDSIGQRPLSGLSSKSAAHSVTRSSYKESSRRSSSTQSLRSSHSTLKSSALSRSHVVSSRSSSGRSSVGSRRGIVPAATNIYRPSTQPNY